MKKSILFLLFILTILTCKKNNPCDGIVCENGGVCINGICDCPDDYEGAMCQDLKIPKKVTFSNFEIIDFPTTNNGANWDLTTPPDIKIEIWKDNILLKSSNVKMDYSGDLPVVFDFSIDFTEVQVGYILHLVDEDIGLNLEDDLMGSFTFVPVHTQLNFPARRIFGGASPISFRVDVSYQF